MLSFFDIYFIYHNINYRTNVIICLFWNTLVYTSSSAGLHKIRYLAVTGKYRLGFYVKVSTVIPGKCFSQ